MPFKDRNKARAYQREWSRKQRLNVSSGKKIEPSLNVKLESAKDLVPVLEAAINEVLNATIEPAMRGRCIAQLAQTTIKLLELDDLEERLSAIEARLGA